MPKEMFHDRTVPDSDGGQHPVVALRVGWERDGYPGVVLATEDLSRNENDPHRGWFVTLDRSQVNGVINALRRARDQVFGKDA